jgi:hypothetical protein
MSVFRSEFFIYRSIKFLPLIDRKRKELVAVQGFEPRTLRI